MTKAGNEFRIRVIDRYAVRHNNIPPFLEKQAARAFTLFCYAFYQGDTCKSITLPFHPRMTIMPGNHPKFKWTKNILELRRLTREHQGNTEVYNNSIDTIVD